MMPLSKFGTELRIFRAKHDLRMKDIATAVGVSLAYISSIEHGRVNTPKGFLDRLFSAYKMDEQQRKILSETQASERTNVKFVLSKYDTLTGDILKKLYEKIAVLTDEQKQSILNILN